jgi:predicted DNA-binding protein (UPF0251 family)
MNRRKPPWIPLSRHLVAQLRAADPEYHAPQHNPPTTSVAKRQTRPVELVVDEYNSLRAQGLTRAEIAATLGMTPDGLQRALDRARVSGMDVAA